MTGRPWWDPEPDDDELEPELPAIAAAAAVLAEHPDEILRQLELEPAPYSTIRCTCGRLRLAFGGVVAGPCVHEPRLGL